MKLAATHADPALPTLGARVLRGVLLPLAVTWLVGTGIALWVAMHFTEQAFDRAMLDDAYGMAANVQAGERGMTLDLSQRELSTVLFDPNERVFFAVMNADGSLLAGQADLQAPGPLDGATHRFSHVQHQGRRLRAVVLRVEAPRPFSVVIAQTTRTRAAMVERLLVYSIAPQVLLLLLLAALLWRRIARELRPLKQLQRALDERIARDLAPVGAERSSRDLAPLTDAVNALFGRLGHSVEAQREFAGNVAHELRTPLAGIRALADYGLAQSEPQVWREQLDRISEREARASHLIDQLLGLALASEGATGVQLVPVRLDRVVADTVLRHIDRADARGVDLGALGIEQAIAVQATLPLLEGILDNLVDNALRYGGPTLTLALDGPCLRVIDDGPGISPEARARLLHRWSQGEDGQQLGLGAGLGLSIVSRYVVVLGARIDCSKRREADCRWRSGSRQSAEYRPGRPPADRRTHRRPSTTRNRPASG